MDNSKVDAMQALQEKYRNKLPQKFDQISLLRQNFETGNPADSLIALREMLHQLAGSAGLYGYPEASQFAKKGETLLVHMIENNVTTSNVQRLDEIVYQLKKSFKLSE